MPTTRARGAPLLVAIGMAAVLAACARPAPPGQSAPPHGAAAPPTATTTSPALVPRVHAGRGEVVVTLFHETHMHGALLGQDQQSLGGLVPADGRTFATYAGVLDQQRRRLPPGSSLFVGNGDDLSDQLEVPAVFGGGTVRTQGRHVLEALAAAGLDADTYGFDVDAYVPDRTDHLRGLVARSRFAWVSANVREGSRPAEAFAARQGARLWLLEQVGGVQVGITGVASPDFVLGDGAHAARLAPTVTLLDPVTALREVVPRMRAAGAQVVVVLSHLVFEQMEQVARQVEGAVVPGGQGDPGSLLRRPVAARHRERSWCQRAASPRGCGPTTSPTSAATGGLRPAPPTPARHSRAPRPTDEAPTADRSEATADQTTGPAAAEDRLHALPGQAAGSPDPPQAPPAPKSVAPRPDGVRQDDHADRQGRVGSCSRPARRA
jgi:hypothetical protein